MAWQNPNLSTNKTEERRQKDASNFQKMVQMLGMARQTDGQTMLGFALGKLLRGAYNNYLSKQYEAGQRATLHQPLTGEALQREENFRQYMGIPTMQEYVNQNVGYGGGLTPQQRAAQELLPLNTRSASKETTQVATPTKTTTVTTTTNTPNEKDTSGWATTEKKPNSFADMVANLKEAQANLEDPYRDYRYLTKKFF